MMKMRKLTSIILALVLCISLAVSASAAVAGIYTYVNGTGTQSGNTLITTTYVAKNPDNAYLKTDVQFTDGTNYTGSGSRTSSRGVISFSYNFPIYMAVDCIPVKAFCAHGVQGGTQSESGYVQFNQYTISLT